ncbi:transporter substrate-binding domain-containing protein [Thalassospira australica]|uniref:transporter substrate-binding domain-containing protein n=1 Tax=Thalassospira australica TaxID=1528106 RepID=UPI000AF39C82|nr:transporter substrate-binding domain-containing protein [Thalassospira australica]
MTTIRFIRDAVLMPVIVGISVLVWGMTGAKAQGAVTVKVGAYEYGVVYYYEDGKPGGIVPVLIQRLNDLQDDYKFELVETSSRRRYQDVTDATVDLILLESERWDWGDFDVTFSDPIVTESDLYVALDTHPDVPRLFANVTDSQMLCVLGFHYGFAQYNADPQYLRDNFDVLLRYNEKEVLEGVLAREAPIGIVSVGFLASEYAKHPGLQSRLAIADAPDATYDLVSVLGKDAPIALDQYNDLIGQLHETGEIARLWQQLHDGVLN